jgi:outer membrane assembly lipoprotein YfiO
MDRRYNATAFSLFNGKRIGSVTLSALLSALCLLPLGCSSNSDPEPEPEAKELKTSKDQTSTDTPEAELVQLSKKMYQVGMYSVARDSLASLKDRYPLGAYAKFAEIKHADSFFFNREYNEAAKAYENIIKSYPGSPDLPYVKLQAARSHVASARDAGRDRQPWERGLTIYNEIIEAYPSTEYSDLAKSERRKVIEELSAYDREIIEFYRREGNQAAVDARESRFKERWGTLLSDSPTAGIQPEKSYP